MTLRFAVFESFKSATTLLIGGDAEGLAQLRALFDELADGRRTVASLDDMPWATPVGGVRLDLAVAPDRRDEMVVRGRVVSWRCAAEHCAGFADKVAALLSPPGTSGHQYLEISGREALQVMVSIGEYPESLQPS